MTCPAASIFKESLQGAVAAPRHDLEYFSGDGEEALLLKSLAACAETVSVARDALFRSTHSLLLPEFTKRKTNLEMARAEFEKATTALREYRQRRRGQAAQTST